MKILSVRNCFLIIVCGLAIGDDNCQVGDIRSVAIAEVKDLRPGDVQPARCVGVGPGVWGSQNLLLRIVEVCVFVEVKQDLPAITEDNCANTCSSSWQTVNEICHKPQEQVPVVEGVIWWVCVTDTARSINDERNIDISSAT